MSDAERFDAYYAESRDRLLALAFALTGDLPASRGAVRDAFAGAWHHWSKVGTLEDPDSWVLPHVWAHAQRRHAARIWHRDRRLGDDVTATLDELASLPVPARKALLLAEVTAPASPMLDALAPHLADQTWPRATIVRRAGTRRRRTHALVGAALVAVALVGSGLLVVDQHGVRPTLSAAGDRLTAVPSTGTGEQVLAPDLRISPTTLLSTADVRRSVPARGWQETATQPGRGTTFPCQRQAFPANGTSATMVRGFAAGGGGSRAVVQALQVAASASGARGWFVTANAWFAGCTTPQTQLLEVRRVVRLGDDARQYVLRSWQPPAATVVVGVARSGRTDTVTVTRSPGGPGADLAGNLRLLAAAVQRACATPAGGSCPSTPQAQPVQAPSAGIVPAMLSEFDLPPIAGVSRPWAGTTPKGASTNMAATGCDHSSFSGGGWQDTDTRTFVIPDGHLSPAFGLTETVGRLPASHATAFVSHVRALLATCHTRDPGTKVSVLHGPHGQESWRVHTQVSGKRMLTFYMGLVRVGRAVAQVGFVPDGHHAMTAAQVGAVVRRAGERVRLLR